MRFSRMLVIVPFVVTIFLSAFLLFQVQPIISKYILPWFGGSSSVWTTAMLFFQTLLLAGYAYAYFITRVKLRWQLVIQILVMILTLSILSRSFSRWSSPITPGKEFLPGPNNPPILSILGILTISVGLPYFLLSTTSSMLANWFYRIRVDKSPYTLYAVSNFGSLLGIASYPFVVEPRFTLLTQGTWWSIIFIIYSIVFGICCLLIALISKRIVLFSNKLLVSVVPPSENVECFEGVFIRPPRRRDLVGFRKLMGWLSLSAISTLLLLSTTALITTSIAPVPFLWLLPLGLYLASFMVCFSGKFTFWQNGYAMTFLLFALLLWIIHAQSISMSLVEGLILYTGLLVSGFMLCHGQLYERKPDPVHLNLYYLFIAIGGATGGVVAGIVAPIFFVGIWEFPISLYLISMLAIFILIHRRQSLFYRWMRWQGFTSKREMYGFLVSIITLIAMILPHVRFTSAWRGIPYPAWQDTDNLMVSRNFYGTFKITRTKTDEGIRLALINGRIIHGVQYENKSLRFLPTSYYGPKSGVGLGLAALRDYIASNSGGRPIRAGIIGLGTGTMAVYGQNGDVFRFYEINPEIAITARKYFTYLAESPATVDVVIGDGRLELEKEVKEGKEKPYDILVLDAFSDDAIPVHLLTKEAFELYGNRLAPGGIVAVNISNTYLDLIPVVYGISDQLGFDFLSIESGKGDRGIVPARWVLLTKEKQLFQTIQFSDLIDESNRGRKQIKIWTDDYSNLFQVLKI